MYSYTYKHKHNVSFTQGSMERTEIPDCAFEHILVLGAGLLNSVPGTGLLGPEQTSPLFIWGLAFLRFEYLRSYREGAGLNQ